MRAAFLSGLLMALLIAAGPVSSAEAPPFWGEWKFWFADGFGAGHVYASDAAARSALKSAYETSYGCPATISTVGSATWGSYAADAQAVAYLKHADQKIELEIARGPECEDDLPTLQITLRKQRDEIPPVCPQGYFGPFEIAPAGPWYVCRDEEINYIENPLTADCPPTAGNPCELTTGAKIERVVDYAGPGIDFVRTFRSNLQMQIVAGNWPWPISRHGPLGANWTHNYTSIMLYDSGPLVPTHLIRPSGAVVKLFEIEPHVFMAENGSGIQLRPVDPGDYSRDWFVYLPSGAKELHRPHQSGGPYSPARLYFKELHDPQGNVTTIHYAPEGEVDIGGTVDLVVGPFGHRLEFVYSVPNNSAGAAALDYVLDPAGEKIDFIHHEDDPSRPGSMLRGVTYQDQSTIGYRYRDNYNGSWADFFLRGIIDENGTEFATFEYYDEGIHLNDLRAKSTRHGEFERTEFAYSYTGGMTTVTDALGNATTYVFQPTPFINPGAFEPAWVARNPAEIKHPDGSVSLQANEPDNQRRRTQTTDANGVVTLLEYDAYHLVRRKEGYDPATGTWLRETRYEYLNDTSDLKTLVRNPSVACPGRHRDVSTDYAPGTQWVTSVTVTGFSPFDCDTPISRRTRFSDFNDYGQPRTIDGPRANDRMVVAYYECETGGACGQLKSMTNALGHATQFNSYDAHGRLTRSTDPNGVETIYEYTSRGRLVTVARNHATGSRITRFDYEPTGKIDAVTLPEGGTLDFEWNDAHLLEYVADAAGNRIEYSYDARGDRISERVFDAGGGLRRLLATTRNVSGLPALIQDGDNPALTLAFDAASQLIGTIDPNGNASGYSYDDLGRLQQIIDPVNGPQSTTGYFYDDHDNLISVHAPNDAFTVYEYDDFGNRLKEHSPDRGVTLYGYDSAGDMRCKADARITDGMEFSDCATAQAAGAAWIYAYDRLGRVDVIDFLDTPESPDVDYDYDVGPGQIGRLTSVLNASGDSETILTDYEYDVFGNRTRQTEVVPARFGSQTAETHYAWDANDLLREVTYPNGRIVSYKRVDGRIKAISTVSPFDGTSTDLINRVGYHPFGPPLNIFYSNGWVQVRSLDTAYRPSEILLGNVTGVADGQSYTLDAVGNVVAVTDYVVPSDSMDLRYDELDRMVSDSRIGADSGVDTYTYDANGNRLSRSGTEEYPDQAIDVLSASNRLLSLSSTAVTYDAAGNVELNGLGVRAAYDSAGRLATLQHAGVRTEHSYNGLGELATVVSRSNCGCLCQYTHDYYTFAPDGRLLHYESEKGVRVSTDYIWLDGLPVAAIEESFDTSGEHLPGSTRITYLHADHLGSPALGTDGDGVVVWKNRPDAFGHAQITTAGPDIRLRFPGQVDYGVGGIHYNYYRDYDSRIGRYLQSDPIGLDGGLNTYGYAAQNPLINIDPRGLEVLVGQHPGFVNSQYNPLNHAAIVLRPDNPADFQSHPLFQDTGGAQATIGAQAFGDGSGLFGRLQGVFNYPGDRPSGLKDLTTVCAPGDTGDTEFILRLIQIAEQYNNRAYYSPFPDSYGVTYNSNSFVSGLLRTAGAVPPSLPGLQPGYSRPLPLNGAND